MAYVDYNTYSKTFGYTELTEDEFNSLINKACDYMDDLTNNYYIINSLVADPVKLRKVKFQKACCLMIELMYAYGWGTTTQGGDNQINSGTSWRIGETTWNAGVAKGTATTVDNLNDRGMNLDHVYLMLHGTGLLSRGLTRNGGVIL